MKINYKIRFEYLKHTFVVAMACEGLWWAYVIMHDNIVPL